MKYSKYLLLLTLAFLAFNLDVKSQTEELGWQFGFQHAVYSTLTGVSNTIVTHVKEIYPYYGAKGQSSSWITNSLSGTKATQIARTTYTYLSSPKIVAGLTESKSGSTYSNALMDSLFYNSNDTLSYKHEYTYSGSAWKLSSKTTFMYDSGNLVEKMVMTPSGTTWKKTDSSLYEYDISNTLWRIYDYSYDGSSWLTTYMNITYGGGNVRGDSISEIVYQIYTNGAWRNQARWDFDGTRAAGIESEKQPILQARVYPNPAQSNISVEIPEGTTTMNTCIYDMAGRIVMVENENSISGKTANVNVNSLPKGIYLMKLTTNKGILQSQIVKE